MKDFYLKHLIKQYYDKPKARAEIGVFVERLICINDSILKFINSLDVDTAVGDQLDIIGKWVGVNRYIVNFEKNDFFSFKDQNEESFIADAQKNTQYPIRDYVTSLYRDGYLTDEEFRFFIKIKILKNNANALLFGENSLQEVINFAFNGRAYVVDNLDMTLTITIIGRLKPYFLDRLFFLDLLPRPNGVRYIIRLKSSLYTFGFTGQRMSKGFAIKKGEKKSPIADNK